MMYKNGFSILYFMIYLTCSTLLINLMVQWHNRIQNSFKQSLEKDRTVIDSYLAHDLLIRDLRAAPFFKDKWIELGPTKILWQQKDDTFICWDFYNQGLLRIEGKYSIKNNSWHKSTSTTILSNVKSCMFDFIQKKNGISFVKFSFTTDPTKYQALSLKGTVRTDQGLFL